MSDTSVPRVPAGERPVRVLVIGYDPDFVDYDEPGVPTGLDPGKILEGAQESLARIAQHGWSGTQCMIRPDASAAQTVEQTLLSDSYDCVVIGGGVRLSTKGVPILEAIISSIRRCTPGTPIAFNTGPANSLEAAQRVLAPPASA